MSTKNYIAIFEAYSSLDGKLSCTYYFPALISIKDYAIDTLKKKLTERYDYDYTLVSNNEIMKEFPHEFLELRSNSDIPHVVNIHKVHQSISDNPNCSSTLLEAIIPLDDSTIKTDTLVCISSEQYFEFQNKMHKKASLNEFISYITDEYDDAPITLSIVSNEITLAVENNSFKITNISNETMPDGLDPDSIDELNTYWKFYLRNKVYSHNYKLDKSTERLKQLVQFAQSHGKVIATHLIEAANSP
ncbi:hypothetical protein L1267_12360 [Pseudoalteromonas sp. OFAV1]|uniref:hypothetical protein n=1 Tax=Pseudoalteromonas sp. OFAV1 TaxID=2908892 RepID=UPI001F47E835|nr:hypothetical protein [Pseudoalteromonas sp. OFAV1]MCF2901185.1 hypothetical protein [Pseudoalteromonas sp. OFAV1]